MKSNIHLYLSLVTSKPLEVYRIKQAIKKAGLAVEYLQWDGNKIEEDKAVAHLLLTYRLELLEQSKTISSLAEPVLTWVDSDTGKKNIRVGYADILKVV